MTTLPVSFFRKKNGQQTRIYSFLKKMMILRHTASEPLSSIYSRYAVVEDICCTGLMLSRL
jgi:hypothetical protein